MEFQHWLGGLWEFRPKGRLEQRMTTDLLELKAMPVLDV
jgi:hypothetical protein